MSGSSRPDRFWRSIVLLALAAGVLILAYRLRAIFIPLLVAFLLTYIWNPVVTWMERRTGKLGAIAILYVVFFGVVAAGAAFALPPLARQTVAFVEEGFIGDRLLEDANGNGVWDAGERFEDRNGNGRFDPPKFARLVRWSEARLQGWLGGTEWKELLDRVREKAQGHEGDLLQAAARIGRTLLEGALSGVQGTLAVLSFVVLVPVYMFFLLKNMNLWWERFRTFVPEPYRERALRSLERIHSANAAFFRGQMTISLIEGSILFLGLTVLGVKLSLLFGALYAILAMIPFVGVVVTFALTGLFVLAESGFGVEFLAVTGLFVAIQVLESLVLQPWILGKRTGLHPVIIILSIFIFGELFGFLGLLLAVPLASATIILAEEYLLPFLRTSETAGGSS